MISHKTILNTMQVRPQLIYNVMFALFFCIVSLSSVSLNAQVTIGTRLSPNAGSLLDLKQKDPDTNNVTSSLGLGMPRVKLTEIDQLFPMLEQDADYKSGITKATSDAQHTGLIVFNTNMCIDNNSIYNTGMYVWDGKKWIPLSPADGGGRVLTFNDQEGKKFSARSFGDAGIWMIENLAVTRLRVVHP